MWEPWKRGKNPQRLAAPEPVDSCGEKQQLHACDRHALVGQGSPACRALIGLERHPGQADPPAVLAPRPGAGQWGAHSPANPTFSASLHSCTSLMAGSQHQPTPPLSPVLNLNVAVSGQ